MLAGTRMPSGGWRGSLLPRVRDLFVLLLAVVLVAEAIEGVAAGTPLWPHRSVAASCLVLAGLWGAALRTRGHPAGALDVGVFVAVVGVGWGLGRPTAVLALLTGVVALRALYGGRSSVALATGGVVGAYVLVAALTGGLDAITDPGLLAVLVRAIGMATVVRLAGEALAAHDLAAAWDAVLTEATEDLVTATTVAEVDAVVERALGGIRDAVGAALGGLLPTWRPAPAASDATPAAARRSVARSLAWPVDLDRTLRRLDNDAALARERVSSEERFRVLAENSPDGIYVLELRPTLRYRYLNPAAERVLGVPRAVVYDDPQAAMSRVHAEDGRHLRRVAGAATLAEEPVRLRLVGDGGDIAWVEIEEVVLEHRAGRPITVQGVVRDVTRQWEEELALLRALDQQAAAAQELRHVDEMRATFLRAVSHELRTPLTAVAGSAQTLRRHRVELSEAQTDRLLDAIERQSGRLERLLEDLLDVDRLTRGALEPQRRPTRLLELVDEVAANRSDLRRPMVVQGTEVTVDVDTPKVERIVENLLENAGKHTPEGTHIVVSVEPDPDGARLVVEDDGPGVPPHLREELFEPFAQGPATHGAPSPGTGIGLALVAKLAELHGGSARIESGARGGARFVVTLPGTVTVMPPSEPVAGSVPLRHGGRPLADPGVSV